MLKLPKPKQAIKILSLLVFLMVRQSGSHAIYENKESKIQVVIPIHNNKEISIGVFKKILRDLDMSIDDFWSKK